MKYPTLTKILAQSEGTPRLITTPVFAAAYLRGREENPLTHAVLLPEGEWVEGLKPLCGKVKNIMDDSVMWTNEPPTCSVCQRRWAKLKDAHPEYL